MAISGAVSRATIRKCFLNINYCILSSKNAFKNWDSISVSNGYSLQAFHSKKENKQSKNNNMPCLKLFDYL